MDADGAEVLLAPDALRGHLVYYGRDRAERHLLRPLGGVDIQVLHIRKLRAFRRPQARDYRNLQVTLAQSSHRCPVDGPGGGRRHIAIGDANQVGAIGIDPQLHLGALFKPVVLHHLNSRNRPQDFLHFGGQRAQILVVGRFLARVDIRRPGNMHLHRELHGIGLQLMHRDISAGDFLR